MNHPDPDVLLHFAEGADVAPGVAAHVAQCGACRIQLATLGGFEARLALASELSPAERERLRQISQRVLPTPRRVRPWRRLAGISLVSLAAAVLAVWTLWRGTDGFTEVAVRRYAPDDLVRAERLERYAVEVQFAAPRWLAVWQLAADGAATRLMPHADPLLRWLGAEMPLASGKHRVPAAEVLDFEFAPSQPPSGLVLVATATEPSAAELAAIDAIVTATPRAELAAALLAKWPEARVVAFPPR